MMRGMVFAMALAPVIAVAAEAPEAVKPTQADYAKAQLQTLNDAMQVALAQLVETHARLMATEAELNRVRAQLSDAAKLPKPEAK